LRLIDSSHIPSSAGVEDWLAAKNPIGDDSTTLKSYINIDEGVSTSEIRCIGDIIDDFNAAKDASDVKDGRKMKKSPNHYISRLSRKLSVLLGLYAVMYQVSGSRADEVFRLVNAAENAISRNSVLRQTKISLWSMLPKMQLFEYLLGQSVCISIVLRHMHVNLGRRR